MNENYDDLVRCSSKCKLSDSCARHHTNVSPEMAEKVIIAPFAPNLNHSGQVSCQMFIELK